VAEQLEVIARAVREQEPAVLAGQDRGVQRRQQVTLEDSV